MKIKKRPGLAFDKSRQQLGKLLISNIKIIDIEKKSSDPENIIRNCIGFCAFSKKLKGSLLRKKAAQFLDQELFAVQGIGQPGSRTRALDSFLYKGITGVVNE